MNPCPIPANNQRIERGDARYSIAPGRAGQPKEARLSVPDIEGEERVAEQVDLLHQAERFTEDSRLEPAAGLLPRGGVTLGAVLEQVEVDFATAHVDHPVFEDAR